MKIVVAGGTGQLGSLLCRALREQGEDVVVLSRSEGPGRVVWDGRTQGEWKRCLEGADAVINLSGTVILKKWTPAYFKQIEDSRILSTTAIDDALSTCQSPPKTWINASAVGYYGDSGDREVVEATRAGKDRLGRLCQKWEAACLDSRTPETRKVCLRIGVVLSPEMRIVKMLSTAAKFGVCAPLGSGKQYLSWIHGDDLARMVAWCLREPVTGAINATAPNPSTSKEMAAAFREVYCRPPVPAVPAGLVNLVCSVAGLEPALLLSGQRVMPEIALARGFRFKYEHLEPTVADVLGSVPKAWQPA